MFLKESENNDPILLKLSYAPPEQYSKTGKQGRWTDVYSLACTFYRIATGALVPTAIERLDGATVPPAHTIASDIPLNVSLAVQQAMDLDISKRYLTMDAFIAAFSDYNYGPTDRQPPLLHKDVIMSFAGKIKDWFKKHKQPTATLVVDGVDMQTIPLADGVTATVGRMEGCNIVCTGDSRISRVHCQLTYHAATNKVTVADTSSNGTMMPNGKLLRHGNSMDIDSNAELQIASSNNIVRVVIK